jgi:hypothetical protein
MAIGFFFILPSKSLKSVVITEGEDITHLMSGVEKLTSSMKFIVILLIVIIILNIEVGIILGGEN